MSTASQSDFLGHQLVSLLTRQSLNRLRFKSKGPQHQTVLNEDDTIPSFDVGLSSLLCPATGSAHKRANGDASATSRIEDRVEYFAAPSVKAKYVSSSMAIFFGCTVLERSRQSRIEQTDCISNSSSETIFLSRSDVGLGKHFDHRSLFTADGKGTTNYFASSEGVGIYERDLWPHAAAKKELTAGKHVDAFRILEKSPGNHTIWITFREGPSIEPSEEDSGFQGSSKAFWMRSKASFMETATSRDLCLPTDSHSGAEAEIIAVERKSKEVQAASRRIVWMPLSDDGRTFRFIGESH